MFDYISGEVAAVTDGRIVVDCGGVGFSLTASTFACAECGNKKRVKLPVYLAVREDALELFGFADERERELFMLLISVSGVGPKLAIAVLGGMNADRLASAIASADVAALSSIKGVGKKTAERIALELKNKIGTEGVQTAGGNIVVEADGKAVAALMGLGYDRKEAQDAIAKIYKAGMTTEQIVFAVLHG